MTCMEPNTNLMDFMNQGQKWLKWMLPETSSFLSQRKAMWPSYITVGDVDILQVPACSQKLLCFSAFNLHRLCRHPFSQPWNREEEAEKGLRAPAVVPLNGKWWLLRCSGWSRLRCGRRNEGPQLICWGSASSPLLLHLKNTQREKKFYSKFSEVLLI